MKTTVKRKKVEGLREMQPFRVFHHPDTTATRTLTSKSKHCSSTFYSTITQSITTKTIQVQAVIVSNEEQAPPMINKSIVSNGHLDTIQVSPVIV